MNPLDVLRRARDLFARAWPLWSVRVAAIGALLTTIAAATPDTLLQIWNMLPPEILALVPPAIGRVVPTLLFVLTIVVRMIPQTPASERQSLWKSVSGRVAPRKAGGIAAAALAMIAATMVFEGGYVNHPADPGGETNMGITKRVALASGYTGPMRTLPADVAQSIYYDQYLVQPGYAPLIAIDAAVTRSCSTPPSTWARRAPGAGFSRGSTSCADPSCSSTAASAPARSAPTRRARPGWGRRSSASRCSTSSMQSSATNTGAWSACGRA